MCETKTQQNCAYCTKKKRAWAAQASYYDLISF